MAQVHKDSTEWQSFEEQQRLLLAETIKSLRKEKGLGQDALASLADLHRTHMSLIERSKIDPSFTTLLKIAFALEVKVEVLLSFESV
jgi:DNA-binding XRE family transcriptional regulator